MAAVFVALVLPAVALAQTDDINVRIQALLRQIDELRKEIQLMRGEQASSTGPVACTMDAKICPDGSAVGRTGPKCEFAPCPGTGTGSVNRTNACPVLLRNLFRGASGADVTNLQIFLQREGLFSENPTGYFGTWDPLESTCRHASLSIL